MATLCVEVDKNTCMRLFRNRELGVFVVKMAKDSSETDTGAIQTSKRSE